jgi:signal transduction histidine kinase
MVTLKQYSMNNINIQSGKSLISMYDLFDDVPALVAVITGKDYVFEYANELYKKSIKQTKNIIGLSLKDAIPELAGQGIYEILDEVYKTGKIFQVKEYHVKIDVLGDGNVKNMFFNLFYKPIKNNGNEISGIFVHALEISDLVTTRKEAEQSKEKFKNLLLDAPVATGLYTGKDMIIELANDKMISLWGKNKSILNKKLLNALPEIKDQPFLKILNEVYTTGKIYHATEQKAILEIDGKMVPYWFNFTYKPVFDAAGKVYGILNMAVDVTYQVEAKKKLANAEEKLRSAIEVANLGTWELNPATGVVKLNHRLMEWRGLSEESFLTMADLLEYDPEKETLLSQIKNALEFGSGGIINFEYDNVNPLTGEHKRLHSHGKTFFNEADQAILVAGITQDVTIQKLTKTELENKVASKKADLEDANEDLLQLNANLEQFVYIASHDLQEPLRKINIFSEMLQNSSATINEEGKLYIGKIEKAAKRMSLLINDLLEFSRISSKERVFKPTDLNKIIADIKVDYELLIKQKNAKITVASLPIIEAVPLQMNQLFYNLVGNALKFTKEEGEVIINIDCNMVDAEEKEKLKLNKNFSFCKITVSDNGIGFDQKYASQIFEIFQRLHGKQEYAGTGIGLSLAKKIVDNHGGNISTFSAENEGATFNIILPIVNIGKLKNKNI